jgi:hypothetical protein
MRDGSSLFVEGEQLKEKSKAQSKGKASRVAATALTVVFVLDWLWFVSI